MNMVASDPLEQDFRSFLQDELDKRCKKNPRFSLRAFARTLEVEPSALSKILHGKRALTPKMLMRMASQLGLPEQEIERFTSKQASSRNSDSYRDLKDSAKFRVHKKMKLAIASELLKEAELLLEKFLTDLSDLAASGKGLTQEELYSIEVLLRSEQKNLDPSLLEKL
jgi:plasmid maintenance system antidote protein VapI